MKAAAHVRKKRCGFSTLELLVVCAILMTIAAFSIPEFMVAKHELALQGAGRDLGSLLEQARSIAIKDNQFYAVYVISGSAGSPVSAFADVYPVNPTGFSGNHNGTADPSDPIMFFPGDVSQQPASAAPNTANLKTQWLPSSSTLPTTDAYSGSTPTTTPFFFGPDGLPCTPAAATGGTTCQGNKTQTAYWIFLKDDKRQNWIAVTVTPAGRIRRWMYSSSVWKNY